jgi:hypothetical protein
MSKFSNILWDGSASGYYTWKSQLDITLGEKGLTRCLQAKWKMPIKPITAQQAVHEGTATTQDYDVVARYEVEKNKRIEIYNKAISAIQASVGEKPKAIIFQVMQSGLSSKQQFLQILGRFRNDANDQIEQVIEEIDESFENLPKVDSIGELNTLTGLMYGLNNQLSTIDPSRVKTDRALISKFTRKCSRRIQTLAACIQEGSFAKFTSELETSCAKIDEIRETPARQSIQQLTIQNLTHVKRQAAKDIQSQSLSNSSINGLVRTPFKASACWNCTDREKGIVADHIGSGCKALFCKNCKQAGAKVWSWKSISDEGYHHFGGCKFRQTKPVPNAKRIKMMTVDDDGTGNVYYETDTGVDGPAMTIDNLDM